MRRISVVTPCRNAERLVARTCESILGQTAVRSGRVELEYVVVDGASTDGTVETVRRACGEGAQVVSEPDRSMYDALAKGLRRVTGDVVAYLNAGDFYHPGAFDAVADVFETGRAQWLTGQFLVCNEQGQVIRSLLAHRFRRACIRQGVYGRFLPVFVQQEGTFWSRALLETVDLDRLAQLKLAGDFYLWTRFATRAELAVVDTHLGAYVRHPGQLSENLAAYRREMDLVRERLRPWHLALATVDAAAWVFLPPPAKKWLSPRLLFRWSDRDRRWQ